MLNLDQYSSLGAVLRDALDRWANETCLIEADRDREKTRLTYSDFKDLALPLARAFEDAEFNPRSEEHTSELQPPDQLVCRLLLEKNKATTQTRSSTIPRPSASLPSMGVAMTQP